MTDDENSKFLETLQSHPLPGNFRDLKRIATRILLELKFRETISDPNSRHPLNADTVFRETLRTPPVHMTTDRERAEKLAWWFINNRPIEEAFEISDYKGLSNHVGNLKTKVRAYLGTSIRRLANSGHNAAREINSGPNKGNISNWVNEVEPKRKNRGGELTKTQRNERAHLRAIPALISCVDSFFYWNRLQFPQLVFDICNFSRPVIYGR